MNRLQRIFKFEPFGIALSSATCLFLAGFSIWYCSVGRFPVFPEVDNSYSVLGDAFLHGHTFLPVQPDPQLMALSNPYDPAQFVKVPYLSDISYFHGKYYLYWGPVPAFAFMVWEGITHSPAPGSFAVILSYIGLLLVFLLILFHLRNRYASVSPVSSIGLFLLAGFLNVPYLFLLGSPIVYETSIIAGQLFLFVGLLAWIKYAASGKPAWLIIAGLGWGLAIGSRYNLVFSVAIFVIFALIQIVVTEKRLLSLKRQSFLLIPLAISMLGLLAYNFARFGNPLETGFKYALNSNQIQKHIYSFSFVRANLYMYLFYPFAPTDSFPFIRSKLVSYALAPGWAQISNAKMGDSVFFGLVPSVPMLWLLILLIPAIYLAGKGIIRRRSLRIPGATGWLLTGIILLVGLVQFIFLLFFFWGSMRYIGDFFLSFIIGIAMLCWWVDETLLHQPYLRAIFWLMVAILAFWTGGLGLFSGFDIAPQIFRHSNPVLYRQLALYWNGCYEEFQIALHVLSAFKHFVLRMVGG